MKKTAHKNLINNTRYQNQKIWVNFYTKCNVNGENIKMCADQRNAVKYKQTVEVLQNI